ncbi:carboxypeptidase regulatory-like domain-containing protein [bacterium]|nr:carboxypeptidase regulatory-like domain-containing protein [bacterium]
MAGKREGQPRAVYALLTVVVIVVALVVGLQLASERRGPSYTPVAPASLPPAGPPGVTPAPVATPATPSAATPEVVAATQASLPPMPGRAAGQRPLVYGRVQNDRAQALAQARVVLWRARNAADRSVHALAETRTDGEGRYFLEAPGPGHYTVVADAFGFSPLAESRLRFAASDEVAQVNFTLSAGNLIAGQVLGTANDPIEGALVTAADSPDVSVRKRPARLLMVPRAFQSHMRLPATDGQLLEIDAPMEESPYRAVTDANGYYQIQGLPAGVYTVKVTHSGYAPAFQLFVEAGRRGVDFQLSQGGSISGSVATQAGQPVVGADLALLFKLWVPAGAVRGAESYRLGHSETLRVQSSSSGRYIFDRLPEGEYDLSVKAPGHLEATQPVDLARDQRVEGLDFILDVESIVSGKLTDADGKPLGGGMVTATRVEPGEQGGIAGIAGAETRGESDASGQYRIDNLPAGRYWLAASLPGYQCLERKQIDVEAGATVSGVDFVLTRRAGIFGVVLDGAGRPIAGAAVRMGTRELEATLERALEIMADGGQLEDMETTTDAEGRFSLGNLKNREYEIEVSAEGYETLHLSLPAGMSDARIVLKKAER